MSSTSYNAVTWLLDRNVDEGRGDKLVFEPSRGGALFPHLYADLPLSAVLWETELPLDDAGVHIFPELVP